VTHEMREVESSVNKVIEPLAADAAVSPAPTSDAPSGSRGAVGIAAGARPGAGTAEAVKT
jgi:hypothetical protein